MRVYYDDSPAGAGKTERAIANITRTACKVLFVTERKHSFGELEMRIRRSAASMQTNPTVIHVHGDLDNRGGSVTKEIEELPLRHPHAAHVVVLITHAALLRCDFGGFSGWRIVIDEVPTFLDFEEKITHLDSAYFKRHYMLEKLDDVWCDVTPTAMGSSLSVADVRADDSHAHLAVFHARVLEASKTGSHRHVLCNLPDWAAMEERRVKWCWASTFSLRELEASQRVELLGNRFRSNIGSVLTQFFDGEDVEWIALPPLDKSRRYVERSVFINYFSNRPAAKSYFASISGQRVISHIGAELAKMLPRGNSIWSANESGERGKPSAKELLALPASDYLTPRQAGTNRFQDISHAAMIYAAKPSPNLLSLLSAIGIDPEEWTRSIEHETILQFVTRTSVRAPDNSTAVHLYVFDEAQAKYLKGYFDELPHVSTTVSQVPLPVAITPKRKGGRPPIERTPQQHADWVAKKRRKDRERKRSSRGGG